MQASVVSPPSIGALDDIGDDDGRALFGVAQRDGTAEAGTRAGDNGNSIISKGMGSPFCGSANDLALRR